MLHFANTKVAATRKPGFVLHDLNWLLIYDNWPLPGHRHNEANQLLTAACVNEGVFATFQRVFVQDSSYVCEASASPALHAVRSPAVEA